MRRTIHRDHQSTAWFLLWRQPLACLVRMPWPVFFAAMGLIYLGAILMISLLLAGDQNHLAGGTPRGLPKAFVFAAGAFFANAFNDIRPTSTYCYLVGNLAMVAGIVTISTLTAVVFARLTSNETPLHFSRHLCVSDWNGGHLFCRFVTADPSQWINVHYCLTLILDESPEPGLIQRRVVPLQLLNAGTPQLSQTATLTHPLTADSPLAGLSLDELHRRHAVLIAMVEGIDEVTGAGLLQTHLYCPNDLLPGHRFADLVVQKANGFKQVVLNRLNHTEALTAQLPG